MGCVGLGSADPIYKEKDADSVHSSVERTGEVVLRCLIEYLGEQGGHLIKEFNVEGPPPATPETS
ncbi:hypothetical protein INR49_024655 [Caranx melampygus]|nr:hypothetical protein INR49_024655 [Caranx melampygus]